MSGEQIYVMRADGSDQTPLTVDGVNAEATVRHVRAPVITSVTATPNVLWPANNQMVQVSVDVGVSDDSDPAPACRVTGVTSNESIAGTGWQMIGPLTVDLLAQRFGCGRRTHLHPDRHLHEQLGAQCDGNRERQCAARSREVETAASFTR